MKIQITKRDGSIVNVGEERESKTYKKFDKKETPHEYKMRKNLSQLRVYIGKSHIDDKPEQNVEEKTEKVQISSVYGEMVPATGDNFKNMKVEITNRKGEKYVGGASKSISPYAPASRYSGLYGNGAEIVRDEPEEPVIDSTATEVDEPVKNMDLSDINDAKYDTKYLDHVESPVLDQMTTYAANRKSSEEDTERIEEMRKQTIPMNELKDEDHVIAAHCDSDSIRYRISNIVMKDENDNLQDEEERIEEFNRQKKESFKNDSKEKLNYSSDQDSASTNFYNGKPMPNFEKDRNLKVDKEKLESMKTPPSDDDKEKQYALDQF